jgi:salicylate hydroxylase
VRRGTLVNFLGVTEQRQWTAESWVQPGDPAELAAEFAGWPAPVAALTSAVAQTWRWGLFDRPPSPWWSRGRVSLLGDAAHPMPPFLAQGAAMAIEDAEALAVALAGHPDVPAALKAYEANRRPRTARVQAWSRRNGRVFHLPPAAGELVFRLGAAVAERQLDWLYGYGEKG